MKAVPTDANTHRSDSKFFVQKTCNEPICSKARQAVETEFCVGILHKNVSMEIHFIPLGPISTCLILRAYNAENISHTE
jgi:hypothetical protein